MGPSLWIVHLTRWPIFLLADCSDSGSLLPLNRGDDIENGFLVGMHVPHGGLNSAIFGSDSELNMWTPDQQLGVNYPERTERTD